MNNESRNPKLYLEFNNTPPFPEFVPSLDNLVAIYQQNMFPIPPFCNDETQRFFGTELSQNPFVCYFWLDFVGDKLQVAEGVTQDFLFCIKNLTPVRYTAHICSEHIYIRCAVSSAPCYPLYNILIKGEFPEVLEYWLEDTLECY